MNPLRQLFGQTAVYGFGTVVPRLLNYLLLTPFFTRVFEPGEYGVVTELYAYVVFLMIVLTYGMETGFFRYAKLHKNADEVFSTSQISLLFSSSAFILLIFLFHRNLAGFMDYGSNPEYILWIGVIVGTDAFTSIAFARLRWENKALQFALIRIASVVMNVFLNFWFLYFVPEKAEAGPLPVWMDRLWDPAIGVGYVFISNMASSLFNLLLLSGTIVKLRTGFNVGLWRRIFRYSAPLLIAGLAGTINEALDRVLLKYLLPDPDTAMQQLGIYGANYKIAVLMTLFVQMFRYASEPFYFGRSEQKDARNLFAQVMKYFIIAGLLIFLVVNLYMDLFKHFIGNRFHEGLGIVPVVLAANLLLGVFFNLSIWYKLNNLTKYGAIITIIGALITFSINWLFIPEYGYMASAWAHVFCYGSMVIISYFIGRRIYFVPYPLKRIGAYVLLAVAVFAGSLFTKELSTVSGLVMNTGFLAGFIIIVVFKERRIFRLSGQ